MWTLPKSTGARQEAAGVGAKGRRKGLSFHSADPSAARRYDDDIGNQLNGMETNLNWMQQ